MKIKFVAIVLFTSTLVLTGCCSSGCDSGWSSFSTTYSAGNCCASSCCGSGSW